MPHIRTYQVTFVNLRGALCTARILSDNQDVDDDCPDWPQLLTDCLAKMGYKTTNITAIEEQAMDVPIVPPQAKVTRFPPVRSRHGWIRGAIAVAAIFSVAEMGLSLADHNTLERDIADRHKVRMELMRAVGNAAARDMAVTGERDVRLPAHQERQVRQGSHQEVHGEDGMISTH